MLQSIFLDSSPRIGNHQENVWTGCSLSMYLAILLAESYGFSGNSEFASFRHSVPSINRQIHDKLLDLTCVGINETQLVSQIHLYLNHPGNCAAYNLYHVLDLLVKINRALIALGFSTEGEQALNEISSGARGLMYFLQIQRTRNPIPLFAIRATQKNP